MLTSLRPRGMESPSARNETGTNCKRNHGAPNRGRADTVIHGKHLSVQSQWRRELFDTDFCDVCSRKSHIHCTECSLAHTRIERLLVARACAIGAVDM